ncbi:hypothetical protein HOA87_01720 [bacterium]|jgi:hypothetical protein|nr:hypothetical protein [bacterium]MBT4250466.1 hypothetical protein [bacterium]MBT4927616.1 hypothetical protein [bacterium]MBT5734606.1 hypothetical protein [bacterium]MBT6776686.1 hypothetical protein [bacterium]
MRRLIRPSTGPGKLRLLSLILYLSSYNIVFSQNKPPTAVSRTLQTQNFSADLKTTLKASINALQDLDYTIDVLNSDVGLITASRTTEKKKADVSSDAIELGPSSQNNIDGEIDAEETARQEQAQTCAKIFGFAVVVVFVVVIINAIFGDGDDDNDDEEEEEDNSGSSKGWSRSRHTSNSTHKTVNNYYQDDTPKGPRIYRYKVTINIDEFGSNNTNIRVSASGELEQDGKILESGGIHEQEFFKRFFASMNKSIFLDQNLPTN